MASPNAKARSQEHLTDCQGFLRCLLSIRVRTMRSNNYVHNARALRSIDKATIGTGHGLARSALWGLSCHSTFVT